MKKVFLLFSLLPLFISAQDVTDQYRFANVLLNSRSRVEPELRSSPLPDAPLDSTYMYENWAGKMLVAKYTYEFDDSHIIKRWKTGYSNDREIYNVKSFYTYEPRKYFWIERIDSTYELNRYTTKEKITRTYNEEAFLTDYREYTSLYDSPWGDPEQIYSAVGFDEKNYPILYMDTLYAVGENSNLKDTIIHKWAITYASNAIESMTCYVEVDKEWIPEVKYVISYDELSSNRTMDVFVKENDEDWSHKIGEVIHNFDGRNNFSEYKTKNEAGEITQSFRFEHFYDESATHNVQIENPDTPEIVLDNSTRTLTVNLKDASRGEVILVTASGHIALKQSIDQSATKISLASLQAGYYIVNIRTSGQSSSQAVVLR